MPHVAIKLYAGRSEADKSRLAEAVCAALQTTLGSGADAISVAIEDVDPADWMRAVYEPEIAAKRTTLYRKPGYGPRA